MYVTPKPLHADCMDYICNNFRSLCAHKEVANYATKLRPASIHMKDKDVSIPPEISEVLLRRLSAAGQLTDEIINVFNAPYSTLRNVNIPDGRHLTRRSLKFLQNHKIEVLEVLKLKLTIDDLIDSLGEWSLQNLKSLNVSGGEFRLTPDYSIDSLSKLKNLRILNVSNTSVNTPLLDTITSDLPNLEVLDISNTKILDISPLRKCRHTLKGLIMYQTQVSNKEDVIFELEKLQVLDISDGPPKQTSSNTPPICRDNNAFLSNADALPDLTSLDISGKKCDGEILLKFVQKHPKLDFLGLVCSETCSDAFLVDPNHKHFNANLKVAGHATETQVFIALNSPVYKQRGPFSQKLLYTLFKISLNYVKPRVDCIKLVLDGMKRHPDEIAVQMAGTACLYNLTKGELSHKIHTYTLRDVASACLDAMEKYQGHYQLQKNALLTICSERILQSIKPEKYRCAKLVLDCLCAFDDASMNKMSVAICSILASKLATHETSLLGSNKQYMKKMLLIAADKIESRRTDVTLRFTLSALWNLTDESPDTCKVFISEGGLGLFSLALDMFENESSIETKILGVINNIAEVPELRSHIRTSVILTKLRALLHSSQLDVSYFSAGVLANLACEGDQFWKENSSVISRSELLTELENVIYEWKDPDCEMVAYRSFKPLIPLLKSGYPAVILWAVWAIRHVCSRNESRYRPLLAAEGINMQLRPIVNRFKKVDERLRKLCHDVVAFTEG